jgi:hypothetical protein
MRDTFDVTPACVNLPLVHDLADDQLDLPTTRRINEHMLECASCADEYSFVTELKDAASGLARMVPGDHVWDSIASVVGTAAPAPGDETEYDGIDEPAAASLALVETPRRSWRIGRAIAASVPILAAGALGASMLRDMVVHPAASPSHIVAESGVVSQPVQENVNANASREVASPASRPQRTTRTQLAGVSHTARTGLSPAVTVADRGVDNLTTTASTAHASRTLPAEFLMQYGGHDLLEQSNEGSSEMDREMLAEAEAAIRRCTAALQDNPDDPRIRAALARAYQQKVVALRSLMASSGYASRPTGGVTVAPASIQVPSP